MRWTALRCALAAAVLTAGLSLAVPAAADDKNEGFTKLFNGRDFTGWKFELGKADPEKTFSVKDGVIVATGRPNGYLYSAKSFKNYVLRYDWKYARPDNLTDDTKFSGNSGLLVHIQEPHKVWPKCLEVQGMNRDHGMLINVSGAKGGPFKFDREALTKARRPVGQWNTTEVIVDNGEVVAKVNGVEVSSGKTELTEGPIGFQSEGAEIHFRNILIKEGVRPRP